MTREERQAKIARAIEHDTAKHNDAPRPSLARVTLAWSEVMRQILKMPVPRRDEPAPVAGEIRNAR